mgnify:CR=1 FL=1
MFDSSGRLYLSQQVRELEHDGSYKVLGEIPRCRVNRNAGGSMDSKRLNRSLEQWRDSLVNLSNRNKLLNYKKTKVSTVELSDLPMAEIFDRLSSHQPTYLVGTTPEPTKVAIDEETTDDPGVDSEVTNFDYSKFGDSLFSSATQREVDRVLVNISRAATREFLDKGISPLYLTVGALSWFDEAQDPRISPLILVPVDLHRKAPHEPLELRRTDEDIAVNPALTLKLQDYGIQLPTSEEVLTALAEKGVDDALNIFRNIKFEPNWNIIEHSVLSVFAFQKEAMYRDLKDNQEIVLGNPIIQALGGGTSPEESDFFFDPVDQEDIDEVAPPESTHLVLDADYSQRAAVVAASSGKSFVLDGPPGTGKSQTISNIIGDLIQAGKTVLFVSEKIVALEVVKDRLDFRGLGSFLFELHSHNSTRKEVAKKLGEALKQKPVAPHSMSQTELVNAKNLRIQLNLYSNAANEIREPIGFSFHQILGRLEQLHMAEATPAVNIDIAQITRENFAEIEDALQRLARHWSLQMAGEDAVWFGLVDEAQLAFKLQTAVNALDSLKANYEPIHEAAEALKMSGTFDGPNLHKLLEVWAKGEGFQDKEWLTCADLVEHKKAIGDYFEITSELIEASEKCQEGLGPRWREIGVLEARFDLNKLDSLRPLEIPWDSIPLGTLDGILDAVSEALRTAKVSYENLTQVAEILGISFPKSLDQIRPVKESLEVLLSGDLPNRDWLTGARALKQAEEACGVLQPLTLKTKEARNGSSGFSKTVLELELRDISEFFKGNSSFISQFSAKYREFKKSLMQHSLSTSWKQTLGNLPKALEWKNAEIQLDKAELKNSELLGSAYKSVETDWLHIEANLESAKKILKGFELKNVTQFESKFESRDTQELIAASVRSLESHLNALDTLTTAAKCKSPLNLDDSSFEEFISLLLSAEHELQEAILAVYPVKPMVSLNISVKSLSESLDKLEKYLRKAESATVFLHSKKPLFGDVVINDDLLTWSGVEKLQAKYEWSLQIRELRNLGKNSVNSSSPLTLEEFNALASSVVPRNFSNALTSWNDAWVGVKNLFDPAVHPKLDKQVAEFDSGKNYLETLQKSVQDVDTWLDLSKSVEKLHKYGLEQAIQAAGDLNLNSDLAKRLILKALLVQWVDSVLMSDDRLLDDPTFGRAHFIETYRELDLRLRDQAVSEIIQRAGSRRPRSGQGQAGLIEREADKKARHIPVRELINRSRDVIQGLHPCFMMSPLAVSQYIPADMKFDVVIFDEASQVTPADAINCVYRGHSLIAAGDQKQLPPMSFFASSGLDDESQEEDAAADYDSVLDLMKASGSFNSMTLNWHYRSRHEHLIAFSNASFYGSRLITFPGATAESEDLGVKFFKVKGVYRRSRTADNPIEADEVANRVIHHFDTRRGQSLGVVAFSTAQRDAIENAILVARKSRPDLDQYFESSRQNGFFVNSLEAVQGDERDVIIFSIGYGPDESGKIYKNFGPLSRAGGERRLNVAITRARKLVEIVSSMSASEMGEVDNEGARHLRKYLDFAERGPAAIQMELGESGLGPDSPFEESVISAIKSWGYDVQPQVGVAGYRIDIGVLHPNHPGAYILGVECDGAMYHSSKTARDRDRLRHEILEGLGWKIHHIWGTSWYRHRDRELKNLKDLLEQRAGMQVSGRLTLASSNASQEQINVEFEPNLVADIMSWTVDYETSKPKKLSKGIDLSDYRSIPALSDFVRQVVSVEQPIHVDLLSKRLREQTGIAKVSGQIGENLAEAIAKAKISRAGEFLWLSKSRKTHVRRSGLHTERDIKMIAPEELEAAIHGIVGDSTGVTRKELTTILLQVFGWKRTGVQIESEISKRLESMAKNTILVENDFGIRLL